MRRERAGQTRDRIVEAGARLLRDATVRDWSGVTMRAVADQAGVNERTVYRHFANERALRDAVIHHLEREAGIDLDEMQLENIADITARVLRLVSAHPADPRPRLDPTLEEASRRRNDALQAAVGRRTSGWEGDDQRMAAAILDVQWAVSSYERLLIDWNLPPDEAIQALTWVIGLVAEAVREGRRPRSSVRSSDQGRT